MTDAVTGERIASITQSTFCRGDGGFGGPAWPTPAPHKVPERAPDVVCELKTNPNAALVYRLSGDYNPLHSDPDVAAKAGFPQPILHGPATYGVTGHAILKSVCDYDPARLRAISARFTAPVFPGETFAVSIWQDGPVVSFETRPAWSATSSPSATDARRSPDPGALLERLNGATAERPRI